MSTAVGHPEGSDAIVVIEVTYIQWPSEFPTASCLYCLSFHTWLRADTGFSTENISRTSSESHGKTNRMKTIIITFCLLGAVFANPILHNVVLESNELDSNSTESLSVSQSSENDTSEVQSSEETTSNQSSESESSESTSEDKTSEESASESDEDSEADSMAETKDNSMGSEENIRKSWVFASVVKALSAEDNSSTEVTSQAEQSNEVTGNQPTQTSTSTVTVQSHKNLSPLENPTGSSDSTSDSADTSETTDVTAASNESSSSESHESKDTSDSSDSSDASQSTEDSDASDSTELQQVKAKDCVNGTQSCESEEYFFQSVGDDGHFAVDNLMVPDEDERELSLRR